MDKIFFDSWESLYRTGVIGLFAYVGLILMLRVAGSRTLSQLNAFDLVVTVALGSTLSTVILNKNIALVDGLFALGLLILFQFTISFMSFRSKRKRALRDCRITKDEILQTLPAEGKGTVKGVEYRTWG